MAQFHFLPLMWRDWGESCTYIHPAIRSGSLRDETACHADLLTWMRRKIAVRTSRWGGNGWGWRSGREYGFHLNPKSGKWSSPLYRHTKAPTNWSLVPNKWVVAYLHENVDTICCDFFNSFNHLRRRNPVVKSYIKMSRNERIMNYFFNLKEKVWK